MRKGRIRTGHEPVTCCLGWGNPGIFCTEKLKKSPENYTVPKMLKITG